MRRKKGRLSDFVFSFSILMVLVGYALEYAYPWLQEIPSRCLRSVGDALTCINEFEPASAEDYLQAARQQHATPSQDQQEPTTQTLAQKTVQEEGQGIWLAMK